MRARLLAVSLAALLIPGWLVASAQTETEDSPFQVIRVDGYAYSVDPFFPCVAFITERVIRLDPDEEIAATVTLQLFVRDGDQMTAIPPFTTDDNDLTAQAAVGQAFTCAPQVESTGGGLADG